MTSKETDMSYLAGIIDGEGTIGIYKGKGRGYRLSFSVGNTNYKLIKWLKRNYGGSEYKVRTKEGLAQQWKWHIVKHREIYKLCIEILPFLVVKREVCELCIEAYEGTFKWDYNRLGNIVPVYANRKRDGYYRRSLELNQTGVGGGHNVITEPILKKRTITLEEYE